MSSPIACSACFSDQGLRLDAQELGADAPGGCPNCGRSDGKKLSREALLDLADRFFVWGSLWRPRYGGAPTIQFNEHQKTSIKVSSWLVPDIRLFESLLGVGFFFYGPRLWMLGDIEPLKQLQKATTRNPIIQRILREYPTRVVGPDNHFYRVRKSPTVPEDPSQYDSPPNSLNGKGRLDSRALPVLYASPDLQVCVHESRVTAEDELYFATLAPSSSLRLLDLSKLLLEDVTEFESLDIAVHMLFLAGRHAYVVSRAIAAAAKMAGFDGIVYPSYFSLLRLGSRPFQTVYGMSLRRVPQYRGHEEATSVPNLGIFGRPIEQGLVSVRCIDRLVIRRVAYDFHFGPVPSEELI